MNKEKWIDEILQSTKNMQKVESNPFLATRVEEKLQKGINGKISLRSVYATVAIMLVILIVNITVWRNTTTGQSSPVQQLVQEYGFSSHDFYSMNYSN
jgi:hypothetical protein